MSTKKTNKAVIAGVTAGLLAGGGFALVATLPGGAGASPSAAAVVDDTTAPSSTDPAATDSSGTGSSDTTDDSADTGERGEWLTEALQPLVDDGTITQAQLDAVIAALQDARPDHGPGMGGRGGPGFGAGLSTVAETIGITEDELRTQLQEDGATIASVAEANGSSAQAVIDALVAAAKTHLDEEVAEGDHTQAEADEKLADITERITAMVNGELPAGGPGMGGPGRGHGPWGDGDGPGAPPSEDDDTTSTTTG
jgi:hypothetical protein